MSYRMPAPDSSPETPSPASIRWPALHGLGRVLCAFLRGVCCVPSALWTERTLVAYVTRALFWWAAAPLTFALYGLRFAGGAYDEPRTRDPVSGKLIVRDWSERIVCACLDDGGAMAMCVISCLAWVAVVLVIVARCADA